MTAALLVLQHIACEPPAAFEDQLRDRGLDPREAAEAGHPVWGVCLGAQLSRSLFGRWLEHAVGVPGRAVG